MREAFLLGGGGQVGRAVARRLLEDGWGVRVGTRSGQPVPGATGVVVDRTIPGDLGRALGAGADLLLDCVCYDDEQAGQLLDVGDRVASLVVLSSGSVYADEQGRSFDEATTAEEFPRFPVPIVEEQTTVLPGPKTYSTRKVAMERRLLDQDAVPVTVLRPGAIHGPHSVHAREWFFVKRALDHRPVVVLAYYGRSQFHPTGVENLAQGDSPWGIPLPFIASTARAQALLGDTPVKTYAEQLADDVAWLVQATAGRDWREVLPELANDYGVDFFDYAAEQRYVSTVTGTVP